MQYEGKLLRYKDTATIATFDQAYTDQTAIVIYSTTSTANVKSHVHDMAVKGIEAVYFGVDCCYHVFSLDLLNAVAAAVAAG